MKNKYKVISIIGVVLVLLLIIFVNIDNKEIRTIKNEKQLNKIYGNSSSYYGYDNFSFVEKIVFLPFSMLINDYSVKYNIRYTVDGWETVDYAEGLKSDAVLNSESNTSNKDYSKTNIQVEGVDEADIIKTDGDFIYSLSENNVVITNVKDASKPMIEAKVSNGVPMDLILYKDKLIVIATNENNNYNNNTIVSIYNIKDKSNPKLEKSFELYEPYYTSRCIDGKLYIFSSGYLRKEKDEIVRDYKEDNKKKTISFNNIKYLKDSKSNVQTLIASVDLDKIDKKIELSSYLIDISDAYVSKDNIYLVDSRYDYSYDNLRISDLFGFKGVFGLFDEDNSYSYGKTTKIYKFKLDNGVSYVNKTKLEGSIVNQYSLDEENHNLRVAVEGDEGTRVVVLDKNLKEIGKTESVAKGEKMYASRFMDDKAYLVTYQNTDPLFVIDLKDSKNPKVMGELKIPGYSTYLHPYDDTHLIGIGMETEERVDRDLDGKVISTRAVVTGMKMSLFDVSDIKNPKQLSKTTIGDSRTVSAILSNPKALLFSKEKELIAIPVNNYNEDFEVEESSDTGAEISDFNYKSKDYVGEGYFVYNVNLEDGFNLKGIINHEKSKSVYYYYYDSRLLRGLYIDNDLFTVSEDMLKVHTLDKLEEVSELKLKGEK